MKKPKELITFKLVEKNMNAYKNHRSYTTTGSTNVDPSDSIDKILRKYKKAWDTLAVSTHPQS